MADEIDLVEWFNSFDADYWFKLSKDKDSTYPKERSLLYNLGRLATRGATPTQKQLDWAKKIVERVRVTKTLIYPPRTAEKWRQWITRRRSTSQ